jgi:hypothetical protein
VEPDLRPAVHDLTLTSALTSGVGFAACAVLSLTSDEHGILATMAIVLVLLAAAGPFASRRLAGPIVAEAVDVEQATARGGLGRPVVWSLATEIVALALCVPLGILTPGLAGGFAGIGLWWLCAAGWLRLWERRQGRRLLYHPVHRVAGTGRRVLGRGWFDPANFVSAPGR